MFNPGTFAMDDGGRCLLDVINDPLLLQSFLEDKNEEVSKELSSLDVLLGRDEVSSTTSCLPARCELSESMGYGCSGTDKPVALAVSATTATGSDVSASSSPQLLVSSSTVPPAAPPPATGASNGLPGASPHSTRSSPASSRPHSASPLPAPVPVSVSWSSPSPVPSRSQGLPSSSVSTPATTKATATVAPLPVAPQQAPASRPGIAQVVSASPSPRTSGAPRLIQPKQPQILPKLSSGSANMTTPAATATTRSQSPRAAQHKATPQPAPVPAPQPVTTVQRGAAMGLNTGSPLLIGNPAAAQPGMFQAGPAQGTFLLNQYIPGLGHSPILIQGALGQIQGSLGQIQGVQLALRPPHATGLTLGPQAGSRPHGGHPGPPGTPTLVIPQNLGPRPNIFLAPPRMMSPPSFAIVPGQPLTLQQLQAMLPAQTMLAQPTLGAFQTDQHQSLVQIPTFTQPQILAQDHHHHHHHHHHGTLSAPLISTGGSMVSSAPTANIVTHHPVMTTTTVLHPAPPQHLPVSVSAPMTSATIHHQPQAPTTTAPPAAEKPTKVPSLNLAALLKEHGIVPDSTPPPSPTSNQENTISVEVPIAPAPVTESVQVMVSKAPQTAAVSPRIQLSLAHDGSVLVHPPGSTLSSMPAPAPSPGLVATTVTPTPTSAPGATALSRTHSALLERLSAAPPVSVPDLASLTAPRVSVSTPTVVASPSLVAPSVVTPSMMTATTHPHQLTLHTVNNGLVPAQQLGQPQSFVTLHGTAVANMLCHGANNARINHIVVSPSPSLGQQQQHHHHQHAVHHTCHAVVSSAPSAVVPTTTTTAVMASSQAVVGRTATAVPTSMAHTVVTMATCPTVTSVTVTPTVVVTTSNSSATAHGSGKCTAPMNSQNQQLYEQLQSQITYLNSLKKPTMQQKLLLHQMLAIEEKLRDSSKPLRSSQARNLALITAVPTSHAHCMQRHEVKPTVVSHPMPAAATIITAKPSAVTTVQVPTIAVTTTTRTTSRTTHHKVNHADVKPKASILHAGNAASIISTQKAVTSHPGPVRIIAAAPTTTSAACASSTCSSAPCSSALSVPLASAAPMLSSPSVVSVSSASLVSNAPLVSAAPLASSGSLLSTSTLASSSMTPVSSAPLVPSLPVAPNAPLVSSVPPASTAPSLVPNMPVVSCAPSAPVAPLPSNMPAMPRIPPTPTAPLASMPVVSCVSSAPTTPSMVSDTLVVSCAPSSHYTAPLMSHMPVVSSCVLSAHMTPVMSKAIVVSCAPSVPTAPLVSSKPLVSCLPPASTSALISSVPPMSTALSVSSAPHTSGMLLVSTAALMSSPSPLTSCAPLMSSAPLVSIAPAVSSAPLMSTTPMTSTAPSVTYPSLVSSAPVMSTASLTAPSTTDMAVPSMASHPGASSHLRVPNPASAKLMPLLHHGVHHHHLHQHHHHHHQPSPVGSSMSPVNQRSPPQAKLVRLQHPTNHIIAPPSTTKQILVQVPSVVNKPPPSKSSGSGNSSSTKSSVPLLPSKVEPAILPKTPLPPPEQPPAPPPPPPKPVVVKPKVPDRVQKIHAFHQRLMEDQNSAVTPDTKNPFSSRQDACERLLRYHVYDSELPREEDLHKTDEAFAEVSERLLGESRKLYQKFHYLMLKEGMREYPTSEKIMVEKLFVEHETDALVAEKRAAEEGHYSNLEPPTLPPMPEGAWSFESSPSLPLPRPVKKEPPDSWLDDDDRSDLEPAPKRRSIKEEEHETVMAPAEVDPLPLPRVSVTPEHVDLVLSMRKELDMSPPETDEFARDLADFEPPMARFPSSADLKQQFGNGGGIVPPVMVPDWTCGVKSADAEPRAPELDLSGIEGLDDDSSGVDPLGRTHYFGDDDEEEDKDSVELHDQVQSAINSILDFRRAGADDGLSVDSRGAVARSGPEPMDYDDATGDAQATDSVLDEAVRSILL